MKMSFTLGCLSFLVCFTGCTNRTPDTPIELPPNYSYVQRDQPYCIAVATDPQRHASHPMLSLDTRSLTSELGKLNLFVNPMSHDGDASTHENTRPIDIVFNISFDITKSRSDRPNEEITTYRAMGTLDAKSLKHGYNLSSDHFATQGQLVRKYDQNQSQKNTPKEEEEELLKKLKQDIVTQIVRTLDLRYPAGGKIIAATDQCAQLTLNKGLKNNLKPNQKCVIYLSDNGLDTPIAIATVTPSESSSTLTIDRWNHADPMTKESITAMQTAPKEFLKNNTLYAVVIAENSKK